MKCIGISLVLWLLASNAFAQGGRGAVTGVVIDPDGNIDYGRETDCSSDCLAIRFEVRSQRTSCDSPRRSICSANIRSTTRALCPALALGCQSDITRIFLTVAVQRLNAPEAIGLEHYPHLKLNHASRAGLGRLTKRDSAQVRSEVGVRCVIERV